jgi:hypothetical protein
MTLFVSSAKSGGTVGAPFAALDISFPGFVVCGHAVPQAGKGKNILIAVEKLSIMNKNNCLKVSFLVVLAAGISMATSAQVASLNITEVSDTTLTYSYLGGPTWTVTSSPLDQWTFNLPLVVGITTAAAAWTEPDNSAMYNLIQVVPAPSSYVINVDSEASNANGNPVVADGGSVVLDNISVTFHDRGDSVPDGGSTGMLLGICLVSLGALRRGLSQFGSA